MKPPFFTRLCAWSFGLATFVISTTALADKVAVMTLTGPGNTKQDLDALRERVREGVTDARHQLPSSTEQTVAEAAVRDGVADTRDEYVAAGRAAGADWTVGGRVESRGHYARIEIEACQVSTGRVESLARNIEPSQQRRKLGEMLSFLLRKEGITNAQIPWQNETPPPPAELTPPPPPAQPPPPTPVAPAQPETPPKKYAEGRPFSVAAGAGVLSAVSRPSNAAGTATSLALAGRFGYALPSIPGVEFHAEVGGGVTAPSSVFVDVDARYAIMLVPRAGLYVAPEVGLGGFFPIGGDKKGRFLVRGSPVLGITLIEALSIEAYGDAFAAPGGTGALVLLGGGARVVVRF